jgi:membrane-bound metal-dependent hydrolase YbcI (DUF457 family)
MPSPLGHAIAGYTVALALEQRAARPQGSPALRVSCVLLAMAPDLDLLVGSHRTFSHSFAAVALVALAAGVSTLKIPEDRWRLVLASALAYGSHLLLDYFGVDNGLPSGLQLFWPVEEWFKSAHSIFGPTERHKVFSWPSMITNAVTILRELLLLVPVTLGVWWLRRRL